MTLAIVHLLRCPGPSILRRLKRDIALLRLANRSLVTTAGACLIQCVMHGSAQAIDILPRDYIPLPSGTNVTALYYDFIQSNQFNFVGGSTTTKDTNLRADVGIYRQTYHGDLDGRAWAVQLIAPFGTETGEIAGNRLGSSAGMGDVLVAAGISFLPRRQPTYNIGAVLYVSAPTGDYSHNQALNLGANRWSCDPQIGYTQAIGDKFWFDAAVDAILYSHNDNAGALGATLSQQPTYQGQVWISYVLDPASLISVGYATQLGGAQSIGGLSNGVRTDSQQVRFVYSHFLNRQFQVAGSVGHDVSATGGFQRNIELLLRAAYLY